MNADVIIDELKQSRQIRFNKMQGDIKNKEEISLPNGSNFNAKQNKKFQNLESATTTESDRSEKVEKLKQDQRTSLGLLNEDGDKRVSTATKTTRRRESFIYDEYFLKYETIVFEKENKIEKENSITVRIDPNNSMVGKVANSLNMKVTKYKWDFLWSDNIISPHIWRKLEPHQRVNQFPGVDVLSNKMILTKILSKKSKEFKNDYGFYPRSWQAPQELSEARIYATKNPKTIFIVKPGSGCSGGGIKITTDLNQSFNYESLIVQLYIRNPLLLGGYKFDFRTYVLISSLQPLRIYHYNEGLARFATVPYKTPTNLNFSNRYMHLTNTCINGQNITAYKNNSKIYVRRISEVNELFILRDYNIRKIWKSIDDIVLKTIIAAYPYLLLSYNQIIKQKGRITSAGCHIFGFDILLDSNLVPHLLEVNDLPSLSMLHPTETEFKEDLVRDTFILLNLHKGRPKPENIKDNFYERDDQWFSCSSSTVSLALRNENPNFEKEHLGNFRRIYPTRRTSVYEKFFDASKNIQQLSERMLKININTLERRHSFSAISFRTNQLKKTIKNKVLKNVK